MLIEEGVHCLAVGHLETFVVIVGAFSIGRGLEGSRILLEH
jgi:hypothetical protein